jgi:hypothetical protein
VGSGKLGDWTSTVDASTNARNARVWVADEYIRTDNGQRAREFAVTAWANLNGANVGASNANSRMGAGVIEQYIINGNSVSTNPFVATGLSSALIVGTGANTGNATLAGGTVMLPFINVNAGSTATNLGLMTGVVTHNGNIANLWCVSWQSSGSGNVTTNLATFYHPPGPGGTTITTANIANTARAATNYYAFRNDDNLAKSKLGMLDSFHELNANSATTTGNVTVSKANGQVQTIYPTGDITIASFTNFVTGVVAPNNSIVNTADTVTLIIQQGATPYTVTMPVGNANIRYAGSVSTVVATANTTSMISITGVYNYAVGANQYLVTISPGFS